MTHATRIGIFGGTFDPIHLGHLVAAENARYALGLDRVLFVVANEPWQKIGMRSITAARDRLAAVAAAIAGREGFEASSLEIDRGGPSLTADTVAALRSLDEAAELFLIIGADVVSDLLSWRRLDEIQAGVQLIAINRPGSPQAVPGEGNLAGWRSHAVEIPALEISSTDLRERAADGRPLDFLVPEGAIRLIAERRLYAKER